MQLIKQNILVLFLLSLTTLASANQNSVQGKVLSINNQDQIIFTDLGTPHVQLGDIVSITEPTSFNHNAIAYLKVIGTSDAFSKLAPFETNEVYQLNDSFDFIKIGYFVQTVAPSEAVEQTLQRAAKSVDEQLVALELKVVKDSIEKEVEQVIEMPDIHIDSASEDFVKKVYGLDVVIGDEFGDNWDIVKIQKDFSEHSSVLNKFKDENEMLSQTVDELSAEVSMLRKQKDKLTKESSALKTKHSQLKGELKSISELVDQYVQSRGK